MNLNCKFTVVLMFMVFLSTFAKGEVKISERIDTKKVCETANEIDFPEKDQASEKALKTLEACRSEDFYFGLKQNQDFIKARHCAYSERRKGDFSIFGGSGILMMIYANGFGVDQNLDLAIKFACEYKGATAELEARLNWLQNKKTNKNKSPKEDLHICAHITSGLMSGACAAREESFKEVKREKRVEKLAQSWGESEKKALRLLEGKAKSFFEKRVENELDLSGTARASFQIYERSILKEKFVSSLEKFEKNIFPKKGSSKQLGELEEELARVLSEIQNNPYFEWGTVSKKGIQETQKTWVQYREAWVDFGLRKYNVKNSDSWRIWLTKERILMLKEFLLP